MNPPVSISRRRFLTSSCTFSVLAASIPSIVPAAVLGREQQGSPNGRVVLGCIGVGPQGRGDMGNFLAQTGVQVVAVCDVKKDQLELARKQVNDRYQNRDCAIYQDFRALLARADVDAVLIATPDHWHVPVAIKAAQAGKDIYLEKPMGLSLAEDQRLRKVCQHNKRIFQFGTQQRSSGQFRQACELVRNGRIGQLKQINVWCSASRPGGSTTPVPVPESINYDFWLGPAPLTPYTEDKCCDDSNKKTWWFNTDYALGFVAGWGVHPLDIALWGHPAMFKGDMQVEGKAIFPTEGACNTSVAWDVDFTFADGVGLKFRGTPNGYQQVPMNDLSSWQKRYGRIVDHGTAFEGTDGWVLVDRTAIRTAPERLVEEKSESGGIALPRSSNHARNFLDSVKSRNPAICPIEEAVQADVLCHLSDIATRMGRRLKWNPEKEKFVSDSEANHRLALRAMRSPWAL